MTNSRRRTKTGQIDKNESKMCIELQIQFIKIEIYFQAWLGVWQCFTTWIFSIFRFESVSFYFHFCPVLPAVFHDFLSIFPSACIQMENLKENIGSEYFKPK